MSGYIGNAPVPQATQTRQTFTATSGQTSFATIGYVAGGQFIQVYLNGVLLKLTDDYTAANGSDIVLTSGAATGDILEFITFADFTVNNQNFTGGLTVDNDGSTVLTVDRATSDGTIIDLQKSGSSVGSIGVAAGNRLTIGDGDTGLRMSGSLNTIVPWNVSNNTLVDNAIDLGEATGRFKDLYLSGGVYLGGTGSANKLYDYEQGAFSVGFSGATISATNTTGYYTKIGQLVHWNYYSGASNISGASGNAIITGLPYTVLNNLNAYEPFVTTHNTFFGGSATAGVSGFHNINNTSINFLSTGGTAGISFVNGGSQYIMVCGTYLTAS